MEVKGVVCQDNDIIIIDWLVGVGRRFWERRFFRYSRLLTEKAGSVSARHFFCIIQKRPAILLLFCCLPHSFVPAP